MIEGCDVLFQVASGVRTVSQIAARLQAKPKAVRYHLKRLEERGFVVVTRRRFPARGEGGAWANCYELAAGDRC